MSKLETMDSENSSAEGMLISYLEQDDLISWENGQPVSNFQYEEPEERDPKGVFDFVLQTMVDFGTEGMGDEHVLEMKPDSELFDRYAKIQDLKVKSLKEKIMGRYGFELDDPYYSSDFDGGNSCLGNSFYHFVTKMDYDGVIEAHNGKKYEKGFTEEQVNNALEAVEWPENRDN